MKKRLRKKLHKKYLYDVIYEISVSSYWREKIINLSPVESLVLNKKTVDYVPTYLSNVIRKYSLSYMISRLAHPNGQIIFIFMAEAFPDQVYGCSYNNPNVVER